MSIKLPDFFTYFNGTPNQQEAVRLLEDSMPQSLLQDGSAWVLKYREAPPTPKGKITPELMHQLTSYPANSFDAVFCNDFNDLLQVTGFAAHDDASQMLGANLAHESCNFVYMEEIASGAAYNGRTDLGNIYPGDGQKFKGCGPLQLTGRHNHHKFKQWLLKEKGIDDPKVENSNKPPEIGTGYTANTYPFLSAVDWIERNNLLNIALTKGFDDVCYRINGGWNGYADRRAKYKIWQKFY
tara:strand:+ start:2428 stop:3147 length:720 start_codon:yes stop_codon:yes gene_type:complete